MKKSFNLCREPLELFKHWEEEEEELKKYLFKIDNIKRRKKELQILHVAITSTEYSLGFIKLTIVRFKGEN
jgi:undecaprenyl pyrophosphate synthase